SEPLQRHDHGPWRDTAACRRYGGSRADRLRIEKPGWLVIAADHHPQCSGQVEHYRQVKEIDGPVQRPPSRCLPDRQGPPARAARDISGPPTDYAETLRQADAGLAERYGPTPAEHAEAVRQRYGKDRTFSVPILMTSALAGLVPWAEVPALPFELACLPQSWYRFAGLPVVSYALPALIAIGQTIFHHRLPRNPVIRLIRRLSIKRT